MKKMIPRVQDFLDGMTGRRLTVYATSGCYYLFMALVPVTMILCCLLRYTPFDQEIILTYVNEYFSASLATVVRRIVNAVYASSGTTLTISILLTAFSASAAMRALMNGMDAAYRYKRAGGVLKFYARALLALVMLLLAVLLALGVMVYGGRILELIQTYLPQYDFLDHILSAARFLVVMVILAAFFAVLYTFMPSRRGKFFQQIPGALFAAAAWVVFSMAFSWYVGVSNKFGAYGFLGTIMLTMLWLNYIFFFLLVGGYINSKVIEYRTAGKAEDAPTAEDPAEEPPAEAAPDGPEV